MTAESGDALHQPGVLEDMAQAVEACDRTVAALTALMHLADRSMQRYALKAACKSTAAAASNRLGGSVRGSMDARGVTGDLRAEQAVYVRKQEQGLLRRMKGAALRELAALHAGDGEEGSDEGSEGLDGEEGFDEDSESSEGEGGANGMSEDEGGSDRVSEGSGGAIDGGAELGGEERREGQPSQEDGQAAARSRTRAFADGGLLDAGPLTKKSKS